MSPDKIYMLMQVCHISIFKQYCLQQSLSLLREMPQSYCKDKAELQVALLNAVPAGDMSLSSC